MSSLSIASVEPELRVARDVLDVLREVRDPELRLRTIELFMRLADGDFDVCVMAARRLSCLYLALVDAGMPALPYQVVTDRDLALLGNSFDLSDKRIAVVDDTVVVGSTLFYLKRDIDRLAKGTATIEMFAICIDAQERHEAVVASLAIRDAAQLEIDSERLRDFSSDLSRTLFVNLVPYLGDFPVSQLLSLDAGTTLQVLSDPNWVACDVTSSQATDGLTSSYSFLARGHVASGVRSQLDELAPGFGDLVSVVKVRAYMRLHLNNSLCRLAPLALLREASYAELDNVARGVMDSVADAPAYDDVFPNVQDIEAGSRAKFRFLQVVASAVVAKNFFETVRAHGIVLNEHSLEPQFVDLNFGPTLGPLVHRVIAWVFDQLESDVSPRQSRLRAVQPAALPAGFEPYASAVTRLIDVIGLQYATMPPRTGLVLRVGQCPVGFVSQVFGYINGRIEARERRLLRRLQTVEAFVADYPDPTSRSVDRGLTLPQIATVLLRQGQTEWTLAYASLSLDVCNDSGIVVPINVSDPKTNTVRRLYRIGENSWKTIFPYSQSGRPRGASFDLTDRSTWMVSRFRSAAVEPGLREGLGVPGPEDIAAIKAYRVEVNRIIRPSDTSLPS